MAQVSGDWLERAARGLALAAIRAYQRHLSPHKGFRCAYRAHTGRAGCSELGLRAIRRHGLAAGIAILRDRLFLCGVAHRRYAPMSRRPPRLQRGDCDLGCDLPCDGGCDGPGGKGLSKACDAADCASNCCDCDWPKRDPDKNRKRKGREERDVHIPAKR